MPGSRGTYYEQSTFMDDGRTLSAIGTSRVAPPDHCVVVPLIGDVGRARRWLFRRLSPDCWPKLCKRASTSTNRS